MSDWWMNEREPSSLQRLFPTTVIHTVFMSFPQQSYRCGLKEKSQWTQTKTTQNPYPWFSWKAITSPSFLASTKVESMHAQWPAIPVLKSIPRKCTYWCNRSHKSQNALRSTIPGNQNQYITQVLKIRKR